MIFETGNWLQVHLHKERFPKQWKFKLDPRGDGSFQVLECIGNNGYRIDLPGEYSISATFNVYDLYPFDIIDLMTNSFEDEGDYANIGAKHVSNGMDANIKLSLELIENVKRRSKHHFNTECNKLFTEKCDTCEEEPKFLTHENLQDKVFVNMIEKKK